MFHIFYCFNVEKDKTDVVLQSPRTYWYYYVEISKAQKSHMFQKLNK